MRTVVSEPSILVREARKKYFQRRFGLGVDIMNQDWDNLVLLDACRYDIFAERNTIPGALGSKVSKGSNSKGFIKKNFVNRDLHDTVYITANPNVSRLDQTTFFTVENVIKHQWDEQLQTVHPSDVTDASINALERHPNKRLIVHYMQPHQPYLGPTADDLKHNLEKAGMHANSTFSGDESWTENPLGTTQMWEGAKEGIITWENLRCAYKETLDIVLDYVKMFLDQTDGLTVISSDHGEHLGERQFPYFSKLYGHPYAFTPQLRIVPWLVVGGEERRDIVQEEPIGFDQLGADTAEGRLRALGYLQ